MSYVNSYTNGPVYLEPIEHVYIKRDTGEKYTSVTKVLHSFVEPFEGDIIAERISKQSDDNPKKKPEYIGLTKEQILDYWKELNDTANEYGTALHESIEKYLLSQFTYEGEDELEVAAIKAYSELNIDHGTTTWPERIMFSEEHKLAGTADIIVDIDDVYFDVLDLKTNKEFNYFNKFKKQLKKPLEHLQDCQFHIYSLQLSIYAYMYQLEHPHKKCRSMNLLFWDRSTETFSKIPVIYLKNEAKKILDTHKHLMLFS